VKKSPKFCRHNIDSRFGIVWLYLITGVKLYIKLYIKVPICFLLISKRMQTYANVCKRMHRVCKEIFIGCTNTTLTSCETGAKPYYIVLVVNTFRVNATSTLQRLRLGDAILSRETRFQFVAVGDWLYELKSDGTSENAPLKLKSLEVGRART
jgi:hypothetical protein